MIISQEFSLISEIDPEFIPSLEELLASTVPDLNILTCEEKYKSDNEYFIYHLFFSNKTNGPIGFAKAVVHIDKEVKPTFINRILKKDGLEKSVKWNISKENYSGFVFDPKYAQGMKEASSKAIQKLFKGNEVISQELYFDDINQNTFSKDNTLITKSAIPSALLKNYISYPEYLRSLPVQIQQEIKKTWKAIYQDPEIKFGEYESFKEIFSYKDRGAQQYKEFKRLRPILKYKEVKRPKKFLTLENSYEVLAIIVYTQGHQGNAFFEIIHGIENFKPILFIQMAVIHFYEETSSSRLHALHIEYNNELFHTGFNKKNQLMISTKLVNNDSCKYH